MTNEEKIAHMVLEAVRDNPKVKKAIVGAINEVLDFESGFTDLQAITSRIEYLEVHARETQSMLYHHAVMLEDKV